jgi:alpha-L-fucosidase
MNQLLVRTVARGGNIHFDLSPAAGGTLPMIQQERLVQLGEWLEVNGEAIYGTRRWRATHEGRSVPTYNPHLRPQAGRLRWTATTATPLVHYTATDEAVYAICLAWPGSSLSLAEPAPGPHTEVRLLGFDRPLAWRDEGRGLSIEVPALSVADIPCRQARRGTPHCEDAGGRPPRLYKTLPYHCL